ncbi:MAG: ribosome maturation factor RimP [Spiroplasma sp.]|nr:ribosome maturation factor RimP [Mycoplasmatales bacterium]
MSKVMDKIFAPLSTIVEQNGYIIYDIEFEKEGSKTYLRVFIDSLDGVTIDIDNCVTISREINNYLDANEVSEDEYLLEVSSPGIIRKLKTSQHYTKQIGEKIMIKTFKKIEGFNDKEIVGTLENVEELQIIIDGKCIAFKDIAKAESTFEF